MKGRTTQYKVDLAISQLPRSSHEQSKQAMQKNLGVQRRKRRSNDRLIQGSKAEDRLQALGVGAQVGQDDVPLGAGDEDLALLEVVDVVDADLALLVDALGEPALWLSVLV